MSPATPATPPTDILKRLRDALVRIHDGDNSCLCDHDTPECCEAVGEHCPSCIAAKALEALAVWNAGPATPTPPTEKRRAVLKRHKSNRDGRHGGEFSACPHPDCALFATGPATPTPEGWQEILESLGLVPGATILSVQRRLHVNTPNAMRLLALRELLASGAAVSPQLENVKEDDQSRVVSVPSDRAMGSTASDNEVK